MSCTLRSGARPVWIDCDPAVGLVKDGRPRDVDDGLALIEALGSDRLDVGGVSVVFGNADLEPAYGVAQELIRLSGRKVPLARGAGAAGGFPANTPAVQRLAEHLGHVASTIVALGPLTNVAALLHHHPHLRHRITRIVAVMGRTPGLPFMIGDRGPVRDFNYVLDPDSAELVVRSGVPITFVPFELSVQATITAEHLGTMAATGTATSRYLVERSRAWLEFWTEHFPSDDGFHPWDSAAVAYLLRPDLLACERRGVRFSEVQASAHGVGRATTGKLVTTQRWLELGRDLPHLGDTTFCYGFAPGGREQFVKTIVEGVR